MRLLHVTQLLVLNSQHVRCKRVYVVILLSLPVIILPNTEGTWGVAPAEGQDGTGNHAVGGGAAGAGSGAGVTFRAWLTFTGAVNVKVRCSVEGTGVLRSRSAAGIRACCCA
jgi:hypothetical protein